jgi:glc operon protein GlcG
MSSKKFASLVLGAVLSSVLSIAQAQARKAVAAAIAEARKINVPMAVAVVDTAGQLMAFERLDNTQIGSIGVSQDKAVSAAIYRRSTKVFQDAVAGGGVGLRVLTLRGANAVEGGLPLIVDGKIIGAIGVSGGSAEQDGVVAKAGSDGLAAK